MSPTRVTHTALLDNIETAFAEAYDRDLQAKYELLRDLGHNPEEVIERGRQKIKQLRAKQQLSLAGQMWKRFTQIAEQHKASFDNLNGKQLRQAVEGLLRGKDREQVALAFRDLQSVEDDDLKAILRDAGLLEQLSAFLKLKAD